MNKEEAKKLVSGLTVKQKKELYSLLVSMKETKKLVYSFVESMLNEKK